MAMMRGEFTSLPNSREVEFTLNGFFQSQGFGRPVNSLEPFASTIAVHLSGELVGAAHTAPPPDLIRALMARGAELDDAFESASSVHALQALAVAQHARGKGLGAGLLDECARYVRDELGADALIARVDSTHERLVGWYERHGFTVCAIDEVIQIDGVTLPPVDQLRDAWRPLTSSPRLSIHAVPLGAR
ncbi:GNAT superfamily N-acetyltransferase [Microbacterium sp. BE35]|nr:GNAT superfamily N-acetyltransferase [Microbacterium sp. BE35]